MVAFWTSEEYFSYLRSRPQDQLLPQLDIQNNQIYVAPGEVYCRFRHPNGQLCSDKQRFPTIIKLATHYETAHNLRLAPNATDMRLERGRRSVIGWYGELLQGDLPSWRAKDQQFLQPAQTQSAQTQPAQTQPAQTQPAQTQPAQADQPQTTDEDAPQE